MTEHRRLRHWPLLFVLAIAAALVLTRLGQDYLWSDEGDTAVLASNILKSGVPTAWDGVAFIDSDYGKRVNDDLVMVSHPWLQYYLTAGSFAIFGETAWAARLPFALLGLATIALTYMLVLGATGRRWPAIAAAALLTASVQFLLYSRQSRYYTLSAALTCLLVWQFLRLRSWKSAAAFAATAILLFHSHPVALAPIGAMAVLTLTSASFRSARRGFWAAMPVIAAFTLPWLFIASSGYAENADLIQRAGQFVPRLLQFIVESASVTPLLFVVAALAWAAWRRKPVFSPDERRLAIVVSATILAYGVITAITQTRDTIFSVGLRYTPAVIPFAAMLAAMAVARVSQTRMALAMTLIVLLTFTKIGRLTPWTFWEASAAQRDPTSAVSFHNPEETIDRILRTGQSAYLQSLFTPTVGTTGRVVEYLRANAAPHDVVLTNFAWEPLYFHTRLPLAMTVLSSYPIYQSAKAHGLPDYVFRATEARWIVWHRAWGAYRGQMIDQVIARLADDNLQATPVLTLRGTLWENRENVHFRRFANDRYIYPWYRDVPETVVYRIEPLRHLTPADSGANLP